MGRIIAGILIGFALFFAATHSGFFNDGHIAFSEERLARIDAHMNQAVEQDIMAGGQALIYQNERVVYSKTWGVRDKAAGDPMPEDAIYRIYSMTKPITSVAVMMLYEEGKFLLSDPIGKYIPELADLTVYNSGGLGIISPKTARQPTIEDLLAHKAGFTYGFFHDSPVDRKYLMKGLLQQADKTLGDFVTDLGTIPLLFEPDTRWHYSVATDILSRLVEVVSGQSYGEFLQERIFTPLNMQDTGFTIDPEKAHRVATLYSPVGIAAQFETKGFAARPTGPGLEPAMAQFNEPYQQGARLQSGGGGLLSTTQDYLRFARMLLNGGDLDGKRLLAPDTVKLMRSDVLGSLPNPHSIGQSAPRDGVGFGLGFGVITDRGLAASPLSNGSYYWGGAAGTVFWIDPEKDMIVIFMTQSIPHLTQLREQIRVLTYQAMVEE